MFSARVLLISLVFVAFIMPARAEDGNVQAQYDAMVAQSYDMPEGYDFAKLRALYQKLPTYKPYSLGPVINFKQVLKEIEADPTQERRIIKEYIQKHFALPEAHSRAMTSYKDLGEEKKRAYHEWMMRGLLKTLMRSGDGKSAETAYQVLVISEEYLLARWGMSKEKKGQSLEHKDGRVYDVLSGKNKDTGEDMDMWFDITTIFAIGPY